MENTQLVTTEEYNKALEKWNNFIYKNMWKITQINNLDYATQKELVHIGQIAIWEALISSKTNGKTGNDANGLIKMYIDGRMKNFVMVDLNTVKQKAFKTGKEIEYHTYYTEDYALEIAEDENEIDEVKEKNKVILQVLNKIPNKHKEFFLHKFGLFGRKQMTYKELSKEYEITISQLEWIIRPLQQKIRKKYAKHIQSIT
jgi:RNA polymerase sigma factor (sigma-70 family)